VKLKFPFTDRQKLMLADESKILWIAAGTKTGKSVALFAWAIEGLLAGEAVIFVAPWFFRCQRAFSEVKILLEPFIKSRQCRVNESRLQITSSGGGYLDFRSADNEQNVFGANYDRVILDEASRMAPGIYPAALTTISGTNGQLRAAMNVELGARNWGISNFLRVQKMDAETRARTGENCLTFPTGGDGLVAPEVIERMRSQMAPVLFEALYLGIIPTSDCSLFRNLDTIFTGQELDGPADGQTYMMGLDLARKSDFSVAMIIDSDGCVVKTDRFNLLSWSLQVERVAQLYRTFRCTKVVADATGVGDAVIEQLEAQGLNVEPYIFTLPSRRVLLEELILSCDNRSITIPGTETFRVCRDELESFEYTMDGQTIRYEAPSGAHDDCVMALALANHGWRASRGWVLGVLDAAKRIVADIAAGIRDAFGVLVNVPAPARKTVTVLVPKEVKEAQARVEGYEKLKEKPELCPVCSVKLVGQHPNGFPKTLCRQCGAVDGKMPVKLPEGNICPAEGCGLRMAWSGGVLRCQNHGQPEQPMGEFRPMAVNGMSRRQYQSRNSLIDKFGCSWGRFR
jgi:hypothetical protein